MVEVPGVPLDEVFPIHKADDVLKFGKYKGKSFGDVYKEDYQYLYWLEKHDNFFKIDFEELKLLYPEVEGHLRVPLSERIVDFGKYKGKRYGDITDDTNYLMWLVSIGKLSEEDVEILTTK